MLKPISAALAFCILPPSLYTCARGKIARSDCVPAKFIMPPPKANNCGSNSIQPAEKAGLLSKKKRMSVLETFRQTPARHDFREFTDFDDTIFII